MATLSIISSFEMTDIRGVARSGRQGASDGAIGTAFPLTASTTPAITGLIHGPSGQLATATARKLYDAANDFPATFDYSHIVGDQDFYIQLITAATEVKFKVAAKVPFCIAGFGQLLASAGTTEMSAEPTLAAITKIVIFNASGTTLSYQLAVID